MASAAGGARWRALLAGAEAILADGALGTMLFERGLASGDPPEAWNLTRPDTVRRVHRAYVEAGARILLTNSFGGNRLRAGLHGLETRVDELNVAAARLARAEAERAAGTVMVAGDMGPSGRILEPLGDLSPEDAIGAFAEQAGALIAGGVDVLWIETMSALEELQAALEGARRAASGTPVVATMSFDTRGRTMMGVTPAQAVRAALDRGVVAVGANCGRGSDEMPPVIAQMRRAAPEAVLVAKPNAGMPELAGDRVVYGGSPELMAADAVAAREAGARILGGCCGSTPAHVAAMARALARPAGVSGVRG